MSLSFFRPAVRLSLLLAFPFVSTVPAQKPPPTQGLPWSVFLGGSGFDEAEAFGQSFRAKNGDLLVCGRTASPTFPITTGPGLQGPEDGFVVRIRGGKIIWSMLIGGDGQDAVRAVFEGNAGEIVIAGRTSSLDFPKAKSGFQSTFGGGSAPHGDGFVARLGNAVKGPPTLTWSTYLGGSLDDSVTAVYVAPSNRILVAGWTASANFPTAGRPFQPRLAGGADCFVAWLNPSAKGIAQLPSSSFLGGSQDDVPTAIADGGFVTGWTRSKDFPTPNGWDKMLGGGQDAFLVKIAAGLQTLTYGTFLGGNANDTANGMSLQGSTLVIGGDTASNIFPATTGALQTTFGGGGTLGLDGFLARFDVSTSASIRPVWISYLGGAGDDSVMDVQLGISGLITAVGMTTSNQFPTTPGAFDTKFNGGGTARPGPMDGFVTRIDTAPTIGGQLVYSTFLGGSADQDNVTDVSLSATGSALVVGWTKSSNFPASNNYRGNSDAFVAELDMLPKGVVRIGSGSPGGTIDGPMFMSVNSMPIRGNTAFEIRCTRGPFRGPPVASNGWFAIGLKTNRIGTLIPGLGRTYLAPVASLIVLHQPGMRVGGAIPKTIAKGTRFSCQWMSYHQTATSALPYQYLSDALEITFQ